MKNLLLLFGVTLLLFGCNPTTGNVNSQEITCTENKYSFTIMTVDNHKYLIYEKGGIARMPCECHK